MLLCTSSVLLLFNPPLSRKRTTAGLFPPRKKSVKKNGGVSVKKFSLFDPGATGRVWKILVNADDF
jgi:hypothetical protein